jgi:thiol-disulfide isomerase/thioredoxin
MIRRTVTRGASVVLAALLIALSPSAHAVQPGDTAPEWELTDGDGRDIVFPAHAEGAPSVLFFWATWCPYCHAVMPYLQQIQDDYADARVRIYAIDFKDDGEPVSHMAELGYRFIVLPLGDLVADDYDVWGAPGLIVVDGEGRVVYRRGSTRAPPGKEIAEVWDGEMRAALDEVLGR